MLMSLKELDNLIAKADVNGHILRRALDLNLQKAFELKRCLTWYEFLGNIGKHLHTMGSFPAVTSKCQLL